MIEKTKKEFKEIKTSVKINNICGKSYQFGFIWF